MSCQQKLSWVLEMDTHTFFLYLLTILLTARLMAEIAVRLKAPSVIGELVAGIILGPSLLGWKPMCGAWPIPGRNQLPWP